MSKQVQLVGKSDTNKLSKEQTKFNNYIKRIKLLKEEIEAYKIANTWLIKVGTERILPIERLDVIAHKDFLLAMDGHRELDKLPFRQREVFNDFMLREINDVLKYEKFDDLKAIFDKYSGQDYDQLVAKTEAMAKKHAVDMMNVMYDLDLDEDAEIEDIREKIAHKKAETEAAQETAAEERRSRRKMTDKQQERADKQAAAVSDMNRTTKQIYVDLVKNFHPDQESDEARRQWKTEIMKQVNVAYQENDFLKLMELQISLLEERENRLQGLGDEQLKYFNKSLRQQLEDLEREVESVNPQFNGNPFARFYSPNRAISELQLEKHIKAMKQQTKSRRSNIEFIRSLFGLKEFLRQL
jgi:hypothetical protein